MRLLIRLSDLRFWPQESAMGSALLEMWQRSITDVPASHFQRFVVRTTPDKAVYLYSRTSEGTLSGRVYGGVLGSCDPLLDRDCNRGQFVKHRMSVP